LGLIFLEKVTMKAALFFGSKSDTDTMKKAAEVLRTFDISYKAWILSAHRSGELLAQTVREAEEAGAEVIIAGAGLAAHLPGVIASMTTVPVIGIPLESGGLGGLDALLSIVQMPRQIPVATVGVNNAANAAYLAAEILGVKYPEIKEKLKAFRLSLQKEAAENGGLGVEI
jgi:5-(carboxyamino)imidazole ribonucleotide mutase